jgi:hypothetical protein
MSKQPPSNISDNPVNSLQKTLPSPSTTPNDAPMPSAYRIKFQVCLDLITSQTVLNILLITEY